MTDFSKEFQSWIVCPTWFWDDY